MTDAVDIYWNIVRQLATEAPERLDRLGAGHILGNRGWCRHIHHTLHAEKWPCPVIKMITQAKVIGRTESPAKFLPPA